MQQLDIGHAQTGVVKAERYWICLAHLVIAVAVISVIVVVVAAVMIVESSSVESLDRPARSLTLILTCVLPKNMADPS